MSHEPLTASSSSPQTGVRPVGPGTSGRQGAGVGGERRAALSPSRTKDFMQCPFMFRLRMAGHLLEPGSLATRRGTVVHGVLERLYNFSVSERLPQAALELPLGQWVSHREENPKVMDLLEDADQVETWLEEARGLIYTYFALENPQWLEPTEREFFVQTETGDGLFLRGFMDRLDVAPDGAMRVVDYKTGRSPGTCFMEEVPLQMRFYALALWRLRGRTPARLQLVYLKDGRVLTHDPRLVELERIEMRLAHLWDGVEDCARNGSFHPRRSRLCDWCVFQAQCPFLGGTMSQVPDDGITRFLIARRTAT